MPNHTSIYENEAEKYHELISKQADLDLWIEEIRPLNGLDIVDLGAGTGRFTASLAAKAKSIIALDASEAMLRITADRLTQAGLTNWRTQASDHRKLPLEDQSADLIVAGWSICYLGSTNVQDWEQNIHQVIGEIKRVLRSNGTVIIFETLGTGHDTPTAPDFLKSYYSMLVNNYGFSHKWIRTDYTFDSLLQAEELTRFFFGEELAERVINQNLVHLPECAGIWWLQLPQV
ncbi:methyltransferase domain-containing protein [Paenibacillus sp. LMG 31456]|uniref:Methyltransferase domain-containing protein n=1 Tax=Paenibacillus foliorum TaxID=2654974 RepID=A0A972GX45_9BACL|nr:class I SAM-dependent methyltransferase [Paenibacillus foliorum]NOU97745.1 methyltransferase domain-containing protein [Paenibacillus foliorum]